MAWYWVTLFPSSIGLVLIKGVNMNVLKLFLFLVLWLPTFANATIDVSNLSKEDIIKLQAQIDAQEKIDNTKSLPAQLNEWASLGQNIGQGLVGAAKEMGIAANEFAETTIGQTVIVMLIWKFFGKSVILFMMLFLIPFVIAPLVISSIKRNLCNYELITSNHSFGTLTWTKSHRQYDINEDTSTYIVICYFVMATIWTICLIAL